jgi:hypothetical protein
MGNCTGEYPRVTVTQDVTAAYTAQAGVDTKSVINLDLAAETGYNAQTSIAYYIGNLGHPWCGLHGFPNHGSELQTIHSSVYLGS